MENLSPKQGSITLFTGPMKSGKSQELLIKLNRAHIRNIPYIAFRPRIPQLSRVIKARNIRFRVTAKHVRPDHPEEMMKLAGEARIIAVDEAQFLSKPFNPLLLQWYSEGRKVYLTALDLTFDGQQWPVVKEFKLLPEVKIQNLTAVCEVCAQTATRTYKKPTAPKERTLIGDGEYYEARCYHCWQLGPMAQKEK